MRFLDLPLQIKASLSNRFMLPTDLSSVEVSDSLVPFVRESGAKCLLPVNTEFISGSGFHTHGVYVNKL
jgi:hypothetical protein